MSVRVEFRLIDRGKAIGVQKMDFDNLALAESEREDQMDIFSKTNPYSRWVDMRVLSSD